MTPERGRHGPGSRFGSAMGDFGDPKGRRASSEALAVPSRRLADVAAGGERETCEGEYYDPRDEHGAAGCGGE
jgi:hypothetical protein